MKPGPLLRLLVLAALAVARAGADFTDRLDEALTVTAFHDRLRARVSGTLEEEYYHFDLPPPGLLYAEKDSLFNPRLTLFLDAQVGTQVYVFAQVRADRGFDPTDGPTQRRFDEYALRWTPDADGAISVQVGKFATVVGNWVGRHQSWDNPFITAPLPYENRTGIFDSAAAVSVPELLAWGGVGREPGEVYPDFHKFRVPLLWGPSYASGASVAGTAGGLDYAVEIKNASLSSRPAVWDVAQTQWQHPTWSGRLGYRPDAAWNLGISASAGPYLRAAAAPTLARGTALDDYRQVVFGQDVSFARHHWQVWAECYEVRFEIPRVGDADTVAYYVEAKYKATPWLAGALRWNRQVYSTLPNGVGGEVRWGNDVWRIDGALDFRLAVPVMLKVEASVGREGGSAGRATALFASQLIVRF